MSDTVKLSWLGHACFRMEYRGFSLITDPYADGSVPGLPPLRTRADAVFCSHDHADHNFIQGVELSGRPAPEDFSAAEARCPHDDQGGQLRGMNTVRLFRFGSLGVAHMGDVGCLPGEDVLSLIRGCSLLLIPVGGFYTADAHTAFEICRAAAPRAVLPMHYRCGGCGYEVLDTVDSFARRFPTQLRLGGRSLVLTEDTPRGLVLLHL